MPTMASVFLFYPRLHCHQYSFDIIVIVYVGAITHISCHNCNMLKGRPAWLLHPGKSKNSIYVFTYIFNSANMLIIDIEY